MPILTYTDVTKQFGPETTVLDTISFAVEPGELVLLTGQTGSGKTTLMKLLTREYTVSSGEIYFNDIPVHQLTLNKLHELRRVLGVVYQDFRLIKDLNVWENIATPLFITKKTEAEIEQRTSDLLNLIGLTHRAAHFPSQLSGGETQRVAIARALALGPELVFADEPTGNLDPETSKGIAQLLDKINELGTTILIATHDPILVEMFAKRRHLELSKGKLVKDSGKGVAKKHEDKPPAKSEKETADTDDEKEVLDTTQEKVEKKATNTPKKPFWHKLFLFSKTTTLSDVATEVADDAEKAVKDDESEKTVHKSNAASKSDKSDDSDGKHDKKEKKDAESDKKEQKKKK